MKRDIVKEKFILCQKSVDATKDDLSIVQDLLDSIDQNNTDIITCVGMAANMIGKLKRIMVVKDDNNKNIVIINPKVLKYTGKSYQIEEGCLCHEGVRLTTRYEKLKIEYRDQNFNLRIKTFSGLTAQTIQHEMDHFEGKLI